MSKTDHARPPRKAKARFAALVRRDQELDDIWTGRAGPKPVLPERVAIREGLTDMVLADLHADMPAKDCEAMEWTPYSKRLSQAARILDLAEWEYVLLYGEDPDLVLEHLAHDPEDAIHTRWCVVCCEEYAWGHYGDFEDESWGDPAEVVDDEDDEPTDWTPPLPVMTLHEAYQELGEDFIIEGPTVTHSEPKDEHYVRVYEVARDLGIEARDLVKDLCLNGEHVRSHMSWVARPVAEYLHSIAPVLQESYGPRKERPPTWARWTPPLTTNNA